MEAKVRGEKRTGGGQERGPKGEHLISEGQGVKGNRG